MRNISKTTLNVTNMSQACLFEMEVSGQISDGKWENSRPYNHWEWICNTEMVISDENSYSGAFHNKRYGIKNLFNEFMKYVEKSEYAWPMRMYYYAKFGTILDPKYINNLDGMRSFIELIGENEEINTLEDLKEKTPEYLKKYFLPEYDEVFSTENIQKFRNSEYSIKDMKKDLAFLHLSVNTYKY